MKKQIRGILCPLLAAFIWGSAFVAQSVGADSVDPFTFCATRSWIGAAMLLLLSFLFRKRIIIPDEHRHTYYRDLLWGGLACGVTLTIATILQQAGISETAAGKAGFITSLYVVLVPIFGLFCRRRASLTVWVSTAIALVGLYLLCVTGDFSIQSSDALIVLCAVFFAVQILLVDRLPHLNGMHLCCAQLTVVAVVSTVLAFLFEQPITTLATANWFPMVYCGVFSSAIAYTLQIVSQKDANPTVVTLLLSTESVFSVLCGWIVLGDVISSRESIGCVLMFGAVILANLPADLFKKK